MSGRKSFGKKTPIRILIVDNHPIVREGLSLCLAAHPDLEVVGEAADIPEALQELAATNPDVAVIDIGLRTGNGLELVKRIKDRDLPVRVLVWSMYDESLYAERALRAGALGYLNKETATGKIVEAIRRVVEGKVFLSEPMAERVLHRAVGHPLSASQPSNLEALSDRELEIFHLLGEGLTIRQIAEKLRVSPKTVETYRGRVKEKLGIQSGQELLRRAMQSVMEQK